MDFLVSGKQPNRCFFLSGREKDVYVRMVRGTDTSVTVAFLLNLAFKAKKVAIL